MDDPVIHMRMINCTSDEFSLYGDVITVGQVSMTGRQSLIDYFLKETEAPSEGNVYVADIPEIHKMTVAEEIRQALPYDEIQYGYCHGNSTKVNALEWHDCEELILAVTDVVLYLGRPDFLEEVNGKSSFKTEKLVAVKLSAGEIVRLKPKILHFAPTKITEEPYRTMIVLKQGTNVPLHGTGKGHLFMTNKWLIAHKDRPDLIAKGAWPGVVGENYDWNALQDSPHVGQSDS